MRRFGILSLALTVAAVGGCIRYGFAGGGLPSHIRTMAVLPFENETASPELQRELFELLRQELRGRLGVREGAEATADAAKKAGRAARDAVTDEDRDSDRDGK